MEYESRPVVQQFQSPLLKKQILEEIWTIFFIPLFFTFVCSFMKVVALLSGGKDSCYNMIECVRHGHQIVCLVNLCPGIA